MNIISFHKFVNKYVNTVGDMVGERFNRTCRGISTRAGEQRFPWWTEEKTIGARSVGRQPYRLFLKPKRMFSNNSSDSSSLSGVLRGHWIQIPVSANFLAIAGMSLRTFWLQPNEHLLRLRAIKDWITFCFCFLVRYSTGLGNHYFAHTSIIKAKTCSEPGLCYQIVLQM